MKGRSQSGFSAIESLFVLLVIGAIVAAGMWVFSRQKNNAFPSHPQVRQVSDDTAPVLQNLGGITLAPYNKTTGLAGSIKFDASLLDQNGGMQVQFTLFGQRVVVPGQPERVSPGFDFRGLAGQINILAGIGGKVLFIKDQTVSRDYEIVVAPADNSTWNISYDHVVDIRVKQGETIISGQVLGRAAPYKNGTYYYSLQVNHKSSANGATVEYVCPSTLLNKDVKAAYVESLDLLVRDWSDFRAHDYYGVQDGGCSKEKLSRKEVDG